MPGPDEVERSQEDEAETESGDSPIFLSPLQQLNAKLHELSKQGEDQIPDTRAEENANEKAKKIRKKIAQVPAHILAVNQRRGPRRWVRSRYRQTDPGFEIQKVEGDHPVNPRGAE